VLDLLNSLPMISLLLLLEGVQKVAPRLKDPCNLWELQNNMDITNISLTQEQLYMIIGMGAGSAVLAILTGKTFRRLLLLPFKLISKKTKTKEDDLLVQEAARDLGLSEDAASEVKHATKSEE
jgi:hypothetical protein